MLSEWVQVMRRNSNGVAARWPLPVLRDWRRGTKGKLIVSENPPSGADGSYNKLGTRRDVYSEYWYRVSRFKAHVCARHNTNPWFCRSCTFCLQQKRRVTLLVNHRISLPLSLSLSISLDGRVEDVLRRSFQIQLIGQPLCHGFVRLSTRDDLGQGCWVWLLPGWVIDHRFCLCIVQAICYGNTY